MTRTKLQRNIIVSTQHDDQKLKREVGTFGAILMGLGSILGTGVFVSLSIAAGVTGSAVISAVMLAAILAICNGLSSAQLAANHPVSGGTYEYGYHYLNPNIGYTAGWMFLCAKSASAATAALGFSGYLLGMLSVPSSKFYLVACAVAICVLVTVVVLCGIRFSNFVNTFIVSTTVLSLSFFIFSGIIKLPENFTNHIHLVPDGNSYSWSDFLQATALVFVAYTGYGRIATLGEEVKSPQTVIPRAVMLTLLFAMLLYMGVAFTSVSLVGAEKYASLQLSAPLEMIARSLFFPGAGYVIAIGAITAMLGVLLNLVLGLSRVLLAMGRRGDMPKLLGKLNKNQTTPTAAVICTGILIVLLTLPGDIKLAWSFSAFTVLIYYAITNLAALKLTAKERYYPPIISIIGLVTCLFLAIWIEWQIIAAAFVLIFVGFMWRVTVHRAILKT